jgi:hypothetical protein
MKLIRFTALAILAFVAMGTVAKAQNADDIIQKHMQAMGGVDKWDNIKTYKSVGSMSVNGMDLGMTNTIITNKGMRIDMSAMGNAGYFIITPTAGWMYMPMMGSDSIIEMPQEQLKMQKNQMNIKGMFLMDKSAITKSEYAGKDTVNNMPCDKVKVTNTDGNEMTVYFDANYYIVRSEGKTKVQDQDMEVSQTYSGFQKLPEGIVVPMTWGTAQGDIVWKSVEINKPVDESILKPSKNKN